MACVKITKKTYNFLQNNDWALLVLKYRNISFQKKDNTYIMTLELNNENATDIYRLIALIYENNSNENNMWIDNDNEYSLTDNEQIKNFLFEFEETDGYPLSFYKLSDIIERRKIINLQQVKELAQIPYSGILPLSGIDIYRINRNFLNDTNHQCIEVEHRDICIKNRYIQNDMHIVKGNVDIENCFIEGDIVISGSAKVNFHQCIITGKVRCSNISYLYLSSTNMKYLCVYNSNLNTFRFEYCKIYRFILHSCKIDKNILCLNKFVEPYICNLEYVDKNVSIDLSQFDRKKINYKTIKKTNRDESISIKNESEFYLNFLWREPIKKIENKEIALDMVDYFLKYGNLKNDHKFQSDMKYKKALYSNEGWRKIFVRLTGAFCIPSRWIMYLIINTIFFTALYSGVESIQFKNVTTNAMEQINFWTALYYSLGQIIGSNPTIYSAIGATQICTTIQALLNTVFIANLFAALINKIIGDER